MNLKHLLKPFIYKSAYLLHYQNILHRRIKHQQLLPILSLHSVSPQPNPSWPSLHPQVFDDLLDYLKKHFSIVTFHELSHPTPKPKLILSFDDGYYDFIEYAMPILKKQQVRANQNIIPAQLLGEKPLWNIALYDFLNAAPPSLIQEINIPKLHIPAKNLNKTQYALQLSRFLKQQNSTQRTQILQDLETNYYPRLKPYPKTRMIRLNEMPEVLAEHEVGVHSYSHESMGNESLDFFIKDFNKCQNFFQQHTFPPLDIYAFPNGSYRDEQIKYLQEQNLKYILLVENTYAKISAPTYYRFNIAASTQYEAIFQALGIKAPRKF